MEFTAQQIASMIEGTIEGDPQTKITGFGKIEVAQHGDITFLANLKYEHYIYNTQASAIIVNENFAPKKGLDCTLIRVKDAYSALAFLLTAYENMTQKKMQGIQQPVYIDATAKVNDQVFIGAFSYIGAHAVIGENVVIYPQVYIGDNVVIDSGSVIHPGVKIYKNCAVGKNVTIHAGTVIGADGFGFAPNEDGSYSKIPQIGNVVIEDNVEIGANTTIDRSTMGSTLIKKGVKLDNLIQIAHNVEIGENTVVAAQAGISGSTRIGKQAIIGGQAGIVGHLSIGDHARINAQSGVTKSMEDNQSFTGSPAYEYRKALKAQSLTRKLPDLNKRVETLEQIIKSLTTDNQ